MEGLDGAAVGKTRLHLKTYSTIIRTLAETANGLDNAEVIQPRGPWRTVEQVELATLESGWCWTNQQLHSQLDYQTPT